MIRSLQIVFISLIALLGWNQVQAQTVYTWTGSVDNQWTVGGNWSPVRSTPASNDIIQFNSGGIVAVTAVPTQTIRQLLVSGSTNLSLEAASTNTLSINGPAATTNLSVASGSTLQLGAGAQVLTVNFATTASQQADISGTLVLNANSNLGSAVATSTFSVSGSVTVNSGATFNSSNASISFASGATYTHARNGGTIPTASWDNASNCVITGITNAALSGGWAQNFGNVLWNCASQSAAHAVAGPTNVAGTFEVRNSNSQYVSVEAARTWSGNVSITGGRFAVRNSATASFNLQVNHFTLDNTSNANARFTVYAGNNTTAYTNNLNVEGDFTLVLAQNAAASPVIEFRGSSNASLQENINLKGNFVQSGTGTGQIGRSSGVSIASFNFNTATTQSYAAVRNDLWGALSTVSQIANGTLSFSGTSVMAPTGANYTMAAGSVLQLGNGTLSNGGNFTMAATGSVLVGASGVLSNSGTFALGASALLGIGSADGISTAGNYTGSIQNTGTRTFPATATYLYNGVADQITGLGLPASLSTGQLQLNNPGNTLSLSQNTAITGAGVLHLQAGRLALGSFNLSLAPSTNLTGAPFSATNMMVTNGTGTLVRTGMTGGTSFLFPLGDASGVYAPASFGLSASSVARDIRIRVSGATHPDLVSNPVADYLSRYWTITPSTIAGTYTYTLTTGYDAGDVNGSLTSMAPSLWNGASWIPFAGSAAAGTLTYAGTLNQSTAALSATGTDFTGRSGALLYYRSVSNGDWATASTWEVATDAGFTAPVAASTAPTALNSALVIVSSGTTVDLNAAITAVDVLVQGTLQNNSTLTAVFTGITGSMQFDAGSVYRHAANGGAIPVASWNTTSTVQITGIGSATSLSNTSGQSFGNWEHNSSSQTSAFSLAAAAASTTYKGYFRMLDSGSGSMSFKSGTAAVTVTVEGDLEVQGGSLIANSGATAGLTLNVLGAMELSAGTFNLSSAAIACVLNLSGNYLQTGGVFTQTSATVSTVNFLGTAAVFNQSAGTYTNTNLNYSLSTAPAAVLQLNSVFSLPVSRSFTVNPSATLVLGNSMTVLGTLTVNGIMDMGTYVISGSGAFNASAATSVLRIGHADGINLVATGALGNVQTSTRTYGAISTYIYNGASVQNSGTGLPAALTTGSLQIDNANGLNLSQNTSITGAGNLTLSNGRFRLGNFNFTLGATALLNGAPFGLSKMVVTDGTGQLINVSGTTAFSFTYPVGDEVGTPEYAPITFNFSVNSVARTIGIRAVGSEHPNNFAGTPHYLNRYWAVTSTANGNNYTLAVTTDYNAADVNGTESLLEFSHFNTATTAWSTYPATVGSNAMTASGMVNTTSNFLQTAFDITGRSATSAYFRSKQSGNWNDVNTWEVSANLAGPYAPATVLPISTNSDRIQVQSGHTVTVTATVTVDDVVNSGTLVVNSAVVFTVANGTAAQDFWAESGSILTNNGTFTVAALANAQFDGLITNNLTLNFNTATAVVGINGTINNTAAATTNGTAATLTFNAGSVYDHQRNAGALPIATWNTTSTVRLTGITTTIPTNISTYSFGHFIHNAPGQTAALSYALTGTATTIKGDFTLESTGSGSLSFKNGTAAVTLTVNGNFIVNNGTLNANIGATAGLTLTVNGDFNQSNGTFNLSTAAIACIFNLDGNYNQTGGTFTQTSTTVSTINYRGVGKSFSQTGGTYTGTYFNYVLTTSPALASWTIQSAFTLATTRTFTVNAGTSLTLGSNITNNGTLTQNGSMYLADYVVSGTGVFTHNAATSFLYIGHAQGISASGATGNIQSTGTRTFGATASYTYYGTVGQITGTGLPASLSTGSLSINNPGNVDLSQTTAITSTGALTLLQGRFRLGNFNFTLSANSPLNGNAPGSGNMIVTNGSGQFFRGFVAGVTAPQLYPIGDDGGNYSPANFGFTNNSAARNIGLRVIDAVHPDIVSNPVADYISRYWAITASVNTGTYAYSLDLTYATSGDVVGTATNMIGSLWYNPSATVWAPKATSLSGNTLTFTGTLNNLTAPLGTATASATDFTGRIGYVSYYRSIADGNWTNVAIWETSNDITFPPAFTDPAVAAPDNSNAAKVIISAATNVTVNTAVTAVDMDVYGTLTRTGGSVGLSGTADFKAGSMYDHAMDGGVFISATLPAAVVWNPSATALISGTTSATGTVNLTGISGQTLGNLRYNSTAQGASILNFGIAANTTIQGDFEVQSTGTGSLQMGTAAYTLFIGGNFSQTGGSLNRGTTGAPNWALDGDFSLSAGTHTQTSTTAGTTTFRGVGKSFTRSGGTYTGTYLNYVVAGSPAASITLNSDVSLATGRTFVVNAGNTLTLASAQSNAGTVTNNGTVVLADYVVSGAGAFVSNAATSVLQIGHAGGIAASGASGNIQTTTRTFGTTSGYIYNGTVPQITGTGLPAAPTTASISIDNASGVQLSQTTTFSGAGAFNLLNGIFDLGNFNLTLIATTTLGGNAPHAGNMIASNGTGQVIKAFPAAASTFTFPVGDISGTAEYSPVTLNFTANSTARNIGVRVVDTRHPQDILLPDYLSRYWVFTNTAAGTHTLNATFTYDPSDVNGTLSNIGLQRYDGNAASATFGLWNAYGSAQLGNDLQLSGASNFLFATAGYTQDFTGRSAIQPLYYRSKQDGPWSDITTWEVSTDPSFVSPSPVAATLVPNSGNSAGIWVRSAHTVTVTANATSVDDLTVDGTLVVNNAITFTIVNGTAAVDFELNGTLNNSGTLNLNTASTVTQVNGTLRNTGTAGVINGLATTLLMQPGSTYDHNRNGGAMVTASWDAASTLLVSGITTTAMTTGLGAQSFGNFIYNSTGQSGATLLSLGATTGIVFKGDFTIQSTGTSTAGMQLGTAGGSVIINGNVSIQGGIFNVTSSATAFTLNLDGHFYQTGGTFTQTGTAASTLNFRGLDKVFNQSSGTFTATNFNYQVANSPIAASLKIQSNLVVAVGRTFTINLNTTATLESAITVNGTFTNNGTCYLADYVVSGTGAFVSNTANSFLFIGHASGVMAAPTAAGNLQTTTRTLGTLSNYTYYGTVAQVTGTGLPTTVSTLTVDNAAGLSLSASIASVTNTLYLNQGLFTLGTFNLSLPATGVIDGNAPSATNMVVADNTGQFIRNFPAGAGTFTYPIGDNTGTAEYSPVTVQFAANSVARNLGVRVTDNRHPQDILVSDYLSRYWSFSNDAAGTHTATVNFTYAAADVNGVLSNIILQRYDPNPASPTYTLWAEYLSSIAAPTITSSSLNNFLLPTAGYTFDVTGRSPSPPLHYRSVSSGDWNVPATWEVSVDPLFVSPAPIAASNVPTALNSGSITVQTGHTVTVTANATSVDDLMVNGTLAINTGITFTIVNGSAANDFVLNGTVNNSGTLNLNTASSLTQVNGTLRNMGASGVANATAATLQMLSGSVYDHNRDGGAMVTATWDAASTLQITGIVSTAMSTGLGAQSFGNVEYNSTGQTGATHLSLGATTGMIVKGNLTWSSTGLSTGSATLGTAGGTVTVNGDLVINGGRFNLATTTAYTLNLDGNYTQTGGDFLQTGTSPSTLNFRGVNKTYVQSGGTVTGTYLNYAVLNSPVAASLSIQSPFTLAASRTFVVNPTATLRIENDITLNGSLTNSGFTYLNDKVLSGTGAFIHNTATSYLYIGHADGISASGATGNVQTSTRTFGTGSHYIYNGTVAQLSGNGLPATLASLSIDNAAGVSMSTNVTSVSSAFNLLQGKLFLGTYNLALATTASIGGNAPSVNNMVVTDNTGSFQRSIPASGWSNPYFWPIGSATAYNPVWMNFTSTTTAGVLGARSVSGAHPLMGSAADYLNTYWQFNIASGLGSYTLSSIVLGYNDAQVSGTEANLSGSYLGGTAWSGYPTTVDAVNNTLTFSNTGNLTQATAPLAGAVYTGRTSTIAYYRTVASGAWSDPAIWEVANNAGFTGALPATVAPDADNNLGITIRNGHVVNVTANTSADQLTIDNTANSTLNINAGVNFILADGFGNDLTLNANSRVFINGTLQNQGQISGASATTHVVQATGTYEHAQNGGTVPTSNWTAGSTCFISGTTSTAPSGLSQTFRNFSWNTPGLTVSNLSLAGALTTIQENLNWQSTGTGSVALNTAATTLNLSGDLNLSGGILNLNAGAAVVSTLNLLGNYNQTGGELTCTATGVSVLNLNGIGKTYSQTGGTVTNTQITYQVNSSTASVTLNSGLSIAAGRNFNVNLGTLNLGTQVISGAGNFVVASSANATVQSGSALGLQASALTGNIQVSGTRTYGILANYTFNGTVAQNTGDGVSGATTLTIANAAGVTAGTSISTVNLVLNAGVYSTSSSNLLIVSGVTGTPISGLLDATACVSGPMERVIPASRSAALTLLYPLGKGGSYNPIEIVNPTTGASGVVQIRAEVFNGASGGSPAPGLATLLNNRYWQVNTTVNAANLTNQGSVRLTETSPAMVGGTHGIGQSPTQTGMYVFKGGTVAGNTIQNSSVLNSGYGYFAIGTIGPISCPAPVLSIGPGGHFNTLTDAAAVLNSVSINCNLILELNPSYTSASETFPITLNNFTYGSGGPFTVTIRPEAGTSPIISGNAAGGILVLNGADHVILDGRPGGSGAPLSLQITNANISGTTISMLNDATQNIVRYVDVSGTNTSGTSGVVFIGTANASGSGNDNLLFENNSFHGAATRPVNLVYATGTASRDNDNITFTGNSFYTWGASSAVEACAVEVGSYNHTWTLSGNSFYQPLAQTTATAHMGIQIVATASANSNFTLTNNFFGGNAAGATGVWTATTTGLDYRFCGIWLNASTSGTSTISGNTIRNFSIASGTAFQTQYSAFTGIYAQGGTTSIQNNQIGDGTVAGNIALTLTPSTTNVHVHGIFQEGNLGVDISGNTVAGLSITNPASSNQLMNLYGIRATTSSISATASITNNTIGSTTVSNSMQNNTGNTYSGTAVVYTSGIHCITARPATISNNTISNLAYTAGGTTTGAGANITTGIYRQNGSDNVIENNQISNISTTSASAATGTSMPVSGILMNVSTGLGQELRGNTIHTIRSLHGSAASQVAGLVLNTPATPTVTATVYSNNFSNPADWTLNQVTGAEGGSPNPWVIGSGEPYAGGACGAAATNALYIQCPGFICNLVGGGGAVYQTGGGVYVSDRSAYTANNISTVGYTALNLNFAWQCMGATTAYGSVRYSIDGGSTWVDLPTQYRNQSTWQCASVPLPAECENISNLRIGFRWRNGTANSDVDPPMIVSNVVIEGQALSAVENAVERNFIHSLSTASSSAASTLHGVYQSGGITKYRNNMIRLGIDAAGAPIANAAGINGITENAGSGEYFHNTIYIGGSATSGSSGSSAYFSNSATGTRDVRNNIFYNARTNSGASGKHYALRVATLTDLVSDYNNIHVTGTGAAVARVATTDYDFLPAWHLASLQDIHSVLGDPVLSNVTGAAAAVNLHITPGATTPIEAAGTAIGTVTIDFDNDIRASNTPTDIGADAGLFNPIDLTPPVITYTPILPQALCSGTTITQVEVNIVDSQSGLSTVANLPRMYFRRKTGAPTTAWSAINSVAGTFVSGTAQNSNWEFSIDYASFGITVSASDVFEYYFVAQDQATSPNVGVSQTDGSTPVHPSVAVMTTAPAFVFPATGTYAFNGVPLSGVVTVGASGDYPSFNGATGLFQAINTQGLSGNLTVRVISDITETAYTPLNKQSEFCGSDYTIRITPDAGTTRTVSGTTGQTLIDIAGAFNLTIDGRNPANLAAGGRHLLFRNSSTFPAIRINNGAHHDSVMYCQLQSRVQNSVQGAGVLTIGGPQASGNEAIDYITVFENRISQPTNIVPALGDIPQMGIQFQGAATAPVSHLSIRRNSVFNFQTTAIGSISPSTGNGNAHITSGAVIDSNRVYQTYDIPTYQYPIVLDVNGLTYGHRITNNLIGGNTEPAPNISGTLTNSKSDGEMVPIFVNVGDAPDSLNATAIEGNLIKNILLSGTGWGNFVGIWVQNGRVRIGDEKRNVIGDSLLANNVECRGGGTALSLTGNSAIMGIWTQSTEEVVIANNLIANLASTNLTTGYCFVDGIAHGSNLYFNDILYNTPGGKVTLRNNRIDFVLSASILQNSAVSSEGFMGYFVYTNSMNNVIENNVLINSGANKLINRNVRVHGMHLGVYGSAVNQGGRVNGNVIASLANSTSGDNTGTILPEVNGLTVAYGNWNVYNNQIFLRNGSTGTPITTTNTLVVGIRDGLANTAGQAATYSNNTVYISGTNGGSAPGNASYAFLRFPNNLGNVAGASITLRNNLFVNDRAGIGNHRVLGNVTSASPATGWNASASNYNRFFSATASVMGRWGTTDYTLAGFQTASGGDANSGWIQTAATTTATTLYPYDLFTNPLYGNLKVLLTNPTAYGFVDGLGTPVAAVNFDFEGEPRDPASPDPGADEFSICQNPAFTLQPANQDVCPGSPAAFNVTATGLAPLSYAWEQSTDGGSTWNPLSDAGVFSGTATQSMSISSSAGMDGHQFRVQISNVCSTIISNAAILNLYDVPAITATSPPSFINNICALSNTGFGVTATGDGLSYQWELSTDAGTTWNPLSNGGNYSGVSNATMFISNTPSSFHEYQYRVVVSGTCPSPVTSVAGVLNVGEVTLNTQPPATTVGCDGSTVTIAVGASGNDLVYQWQLSTNNGATFSPLSNGGVYSGVDLPTLTLTGVTTAMTSYQYRVVIGSVACPSVTSGVSVLGVNPLLSTSVSIAATPGTVICSGTEVTFDATPVNGGASPTYQWYLNGNPVGSGASSYVTSTLAQGDQVQVEMTSNATCPSPAMSSSNTLTMTVNPILPVSVSIATASTTVCAGSSTTFTATPVNGGLSPSYSWTLNGNPVGTDSDTYSSSTLNNGDVVEVTLTSSETCTSGSPATSNTFSMTVQFLGQWLGYTSDWNTTSNWGCGILPTSTTVVTLTNAPLGGNQPEIGNTGIATVLDLNLNAGSSVLIQSGHDLSIYGNLLNNGNPDMGPGTVRFTGTSSHSVSGSATLVLGNMEVNTTIAGTAVMLNQLVNVSGTLSMTNGTLDLNGFDVDFGTTGSLVGETNANRVFGLGLLKATRTLGTSTAYTNIAGLGLSITTDAVAPGQTDFARGHESQAVSVNNSIQRYFDIHPTVNAGLNATLRLAYFQDELADIDATDPLEDQLIPWRSEDNGLSWEGQHYPSRISNDNVANWVQLTQIPAFSRWTLSDWQTEPLPIELLGFNATPAGQTVALDWVTASESNNAYFTVERSADAQHFDFVLQRAGAVNSSILREYHDTDLHPLPGLSYYRLKQTDFNGDFSYSPIVPVFFGAFNQAQVHAWVNTDGRIAINVQAPQSGSGSIRLYDLAGKLLFEFPHEFIEGEQQLLLPHGAWAGGIYLLQVDGFQFHHRQKIVLR